MQPPRSIDARRAHSAVDRPSRPIAVLRWPVVGLLAVLAVLPFLLTPIPPLTDVPGHMGQFSVQTAAAGDGVLRYFGFHWALTLNLAGDLLVQLLHPVMAVVPATWLLCAATPALTAIGIMTLARATNPRGAHAVPWALLFVFNFPFLWGFLNYALTEALAIVALAGWVALGARKRLRAALFVVVTPMLLVGHGVAGIAAVVMIVGYAAWDETTHRWRGWRRTAGAILAEAWPPIVAATLLLAVWKAMGSSDGGATMWLPLRKPAAIVHMLQDQNKAFDIGSVACALIVWCLGWRWGARLSGGPAGALIAVLALFLAAPSLLSGSDEIDTRLAPLIPMLAFALQDWSRVGARRRRAILAAGFALLAPRFVVTTVSFAHYGERYGRELAALDHVAPGARVMNLTLVQCDGWRSERLEHLANLATTFRGAWVNAHWSIDGLHLLQVRYKPSPRYYNDPSQMVFPASCADEAMVANAGYRPMQTVAMAMPSLPLERVDYLWIIGAHLPAAYRDARLRRVWNGQTSALYAVVPRTRSAP